jgi:hypothetical protein
MEIKSRTNVSMFPKKNTFALNLIPTFCCAPVHAGRRQRLRTAAQPSHPDAGRQPVLVPAVQLPGAPRLAAAAGPGRQQTELCRRRGFSHHHGRAAVAQPAGQPDRQHHAQLLLQPDQAAGARPVRQQHHLHPHQLTDEAALAAGPRPQRQPHHENWSSRLPGQIYCQYNSAI